MNVILNKKYKAGAAIARYRLVKFGADDETVIQGAAAGDDLIGAYDGASDAALGDGVDVMHVGIADVEAGGTITRGALLTSDATGRAVAASPGAGTNNGVAGRALASAVVGDIIQMLVNPGSVQG